MIEQPGTLSGFTGVLKVKKKKGKLIISYYLRN